MGKKIACISMDIEPDLRDPEGRVRLFDDAELMDRFKRVIHGQGAMVTGFLVTSLIESYGNVLKDLNRQFPVEFGIHSHDHDAHNACSQDQIHQAVNAFKTFWEIPPSGYRAPNGLITPEGIRHLINYGFQYDSSIFPSIRFDEYGYSNLHFPMEPFIFVHGNQSLIEMPLACLKTIRLVFSLSHVKLLGWHVYRTLMMVFPLPEIVVLNLHPYDFYIPLISSHIKGWKKIAHQRNGSSAFQIFDNILKSLRQKGYEFMFMSELNQYLKEDGRLKKIVLDTNNE